MSSRRCLRVMVALAALVACAAGLPACGGDDEGKQGSVQNPIGGDGGGAKGDEDGGDEVYPGFSSCERERDGTACGPAHHCVEESCAPNRCGDGVKSPEEECDDGNEALGDECDPACRKTPDSCGDGEVNDGAEECDDGNQVNDDGCANSCTNNACGNLRLDVAEECDDGNDTDDDYCSNECLTIRCRNGRVEPGEDCDDGNSINDDGCTNGCIAVRCGDGVTYEGIEECDDGNLDEGDECSSSCQRILCGNSRIEADEVCDGTAIPAGKTGSCKPDCTGLIIDDACDPCRLEDNNCTDYMGLGVNLVDSCFTTAPSGASADFVEKCSALSECIRLSQCDLVDDAIEPNTVRTCFCGAGSDLNECQAESTPLTGPCIDEYLDATGCASDPKPIACVINLASDSTLPSGYAQALAECDRLYCAEACRPQG